MTHGKGGQNCKVCEDGFLVLKKFHWLLSAGLVAESSKARHSALLLHKRFWRLVLGEREGVVVEVVSSGGVCKLCGQRLRLVGFG